MDGLIFIILIISCLFVFLKSFFRYQDILQYPFLITCDLLFFIGPQIFYLLHHKRLYQQYANGALFLFISICLLFYLSALLGYYSERVTFRLPNWKFKPSVLIFGLFVLSLIALYGRIMLASLPVEMMNATQWSGLPVRYLFFASVGQLCLPVGIILFFRYRNKLILFPLLVELSSILTSIVFAGRRSPAAFVGLMGLTGLWFAKRFKIPMWGIISMGVVFFMFVTNVGIYRSLVQQDKEINWNKIVSEVFDFGKTVEQFTSQREGEKGLYIDIQNGVVCAQAVSESFSYNYGTIFWNSLVFAWVPGQIVGRDVKEALMLDLPKPEDVAKKIYGYSLDTGTCIPGYTDIFASFGILGVFFMFFMGKTARMIWEQASCGNLMAQLCHFALAPLYLRFGGGGFWYLLSTLFFWVVFLYPILLLGRRRETMNEISEVEV